MKFIQYFGSIFGLVLYFQKIQVITQQVTDEEIIININSLNIESNICSNDCINEHNYKLITNCLLMKTLIHLIMSSITINLKLR